MSAFQAVLLKVFFVCWGKIQRFWKTKKTMFRSKKSVYFRIDIPARLSDSSQKVITDFFVMNESNCDSKKNNILRQKSGIFSHRYPNWGFWFLWKNKYGNFRHEQIHVHFCKTIFFIKKHVYLRMGTQEGKFQAPRRI